MHGSRVEFSLLVLLAGIALGMGRAQPVSAQVLGDRPLAVPQTSVSSDAPLLLRLPAVKSRPAANALPAVVVERVPDAQLADDVTLPESSYQMPLPEYMTPREQFVPTAWLRWAQDGDPAAGGAAANGSGGAAANNGEGDQATKPEIGAKPPEDINRQALRGTNILLKPGDFQYEISPLYVTNQQRALGLLPNNSITLARIRSHLLLLPIAVRYGWKDNLEVFAVTPFGLSLYQVDDQARNISDQTGVLGDISFGCVRTLPKLKMVPNTTVTFNVVAPTGVSPDVAITTNQAALGNGVWRVGATLNFVESVDPFVLFGGLGFDHPFEKELGGQMLQLGNSFNFYGGVGFAVTDDMSLSAQISGSLQGESQYSGIHIPNTDIEPVSARIAVMRRLTLKSRVQPYLSWGLTEDAADYSLGVRFVYDR